MDITCITLQDWWFGKGWKMTIDLKELAASAGIRKKIVANYGVIETYDEKVLSVPMTRAKKLLRLIRRYGTEEDFLVCDRVFQENEKLNEYWRSIR